MKSARVLKSSSRLTLTPQPGYENVCSIFPANVVNVVLSLLDFVFQLKSIQIALLSAEFRSEPPQKID